MFDKVASFVRSEQSICAAPSRENIQQKYFIEKINAILTISLKIRAKFKVRESLHHGSWLFWSLMSFLEIRFSLAFSRENRAYFPEIYLWIFVALHNELGAFHQWITNWFQFRMLAVVLVKFVCECFAFVFLPAAENNSKYAMIYAVISKRQDICLVTHPNTIPARRF